MALWLILSGIKRFFSLFGEYQVPFLNEALRDLEARMSPSVSLDKLVEVRASLCEVLGCRDGGNANDMYREGLDMSC